MMAGVGVGAQFRRAALRDIDRAVDHLKNHFENTGQYEIMKKSEKSKCAKTPLERSPSRSDIEVVPSPTDTPENATAAHQRRQEGALESVPTVVVDEPPILPSQIDPSKRGANWKPPTPDSAWSPRWKPRKRPVGSHRGRMAQRKAIAAVEEAMFSFGHLLEDLPRDPETGRVLKTDEAMLATLAAVSQGVPLSRVATALGLTRHTLRSWVMAPGWRERYDRAREESYDAIAEEALLLASDPVEMEEVYENYDAEGNLVNRAVKKGDATYARKLAVQTRLELLKKWAPDRYGEKVTVKTDVSLSARILAARRRVSETDEG